MLCILKRIAIAGIGFIIPGIQQSYFIRFSKSNIHRQLRNGRRGLSDSYRFIWNVGVDGRGSNWIVQP